MKVFKHLPNTLTCLNLVCGCLGIVFVLEGRALPAAFFVWAACGFDFFDGFAARWLKVSSAIGKELDSLADMVSFGVLPSVMLYSWLKTETTNEWLPYLAFTVAVFSALRLAKFNIDERQSTSFIGLPTPANALFLTALPFLPSQLLSFISQPWMLTILIIVFSLLLVSEIELFALKFKNFAWAGNEIRFTFLIGAVLLVVILQQSSLPLIILLYILLSLGKSWIRPKLA